MTNYFAARNMISIFLAIFSLSLSACTKDNTQSMLHTASDMADNIQLLWWIMLAYLTLYFILVLVLLAVAVTKKSAKQGEIPGGNKRWILLGGAIVPAVSLIILLIFTMRITSARPIQDPELRIEIIGHKWWWEVRYPEQGIIIANEVYIPQGALVRLDITASDVIHSFWVPALSGKLDMLPDQISELWLQAKHPGTYRGQCAEFCGLQHALMAFFVVVLAEDEFAAWLAERQAPLLELTSELQKRGQEVYFEKGCNACHRIRGTAAKGGVGPDLTHIASRLSLGAGTVPYSRDALANFIVNSQAQKPGNYMPPTVIDEDSLRALVEYLESLK